MANKYNASEREQHCQKFNNWNEIKKYTEFDNGNVFFKERDIFYMKLGKNIGYEQNGKGEKFLRPIIIVRKFNNNIFRGIPLTTKIKQGLYYYNFELDGLPQSVILSQLKLFDSRRLMDKIGMLNIKDFVNLKQKIKELL